MRRFLAALAVALACTAGAAHAQNSPAAQHVLDRARAATGGAGWNMLRGLHESGQVGGMRYERWLDPLRYGARVETHEPGGKHLHGFNGYGDWQIYADGRVTGVVDHPSLAQARTEAFFGVNGFFYPGRFDFRSTYVGVRQAHGRAFEVIRTQPVGGRPKELWFDRGTRLLTRIVDRNGAQPLAVEVSDYRKVGPVLIAFRYTPEGNPLQERRLDAIDFRPADRALFSLPRPER